MIATEEQLLSALAECGFDFTSTPRDIAIRFPKQLDWGVSGFEVLPFRLSRPLAGFGLDWKIPVNREVEFDLPPRQYKHEFHPTDDARTNHDIAHTQLASVFGPGEPSQSTNVYDRHWRVGFFEIRVTTWPRELNLRSSNSFAGKNPYLWISANVYIEPDFPFIHPAEDATSPIHPLIVPARGYTLQCNSQVYARRNRVPAPAGTTVAGEAGGAFLIRTADRSVRVPLEDIQKITHTRMTPGRYSGSSSIALETLFLHRHQVSVPVAAGERTDSLDRAARQLAAALGKPLAVEEYSDDG